MLLSGRAYFRWHGLQASADEPNLPVAVKQAGYITYHHGKKGNSALLIQEKFDINKYFDLSFIEQDLQSFWLDR